MRRPEHGCIFPDDSISLGKNKRPERCPHCGSVRVRREGTRKKKIEIVQLWHCSSRKTVPGTRARPLHLVEWVIALPGYNRFSVVRLDPAPDQGKGRVVAT